MSWKRYHNTAAVFRQIDEISKSSNLTMTRIGGHTKTWGKITSCGMKCEEHGTRNETSYSKRYDKISQYEHISTKYLVIIDKYYINITRNRFLKEFISLPHLTWTVQFLEGLSSRTSIAHSPASWITSELSPFMTFKLHSMNERTLLSVLEYIGWSMFLMAVQYDVIYYRLSLLPSTRVSFMFFNAVTTHSMSVGS
jgi:hypothetical protein